MAEEHAPTIPPGLENRPGEMMARYAARPGEVEALAAQGRLSADYAAHQGPLIHKWHHYLPLYERYLGPYRKGFPAEGGSRPLRFLEIGVSQGGSCVMWRRFFGPEAILAGIDIDPRCAALDGIAGVRVRIGSQTDPAFLQRVVAEMGGLDVVLDDGSHVAAHQRASLDVLFPLLSTGGVYMIEDCQTAYWPGYEGGYRREGTAIEVAKGLIDDLHHWYHPYGQTREATRDFVTGVHFHDSIVVIDKARAPRPVHSKVGAPTF